MRAFEIQGAFGLDNLKLVERPEPRPGPNDVLVKMKACSLNYRDWLMVKGLYNPKQPLPLIPCSDGVGEVVETGGEVTRVKKGQRVAGIFAQKWIDGAFVPEARSSTLGGPHDGMLTELACLDEQGVVAVPDYLSDEEAATLPCAAVTAWNALFGDGGLRPGDTVLLLGTGGVSVFGLLLARMAGCRVIITSSSDEKIQRAVELGASHGINYVSVPAWDREVRRLTDGRGADRILEVGGGVTMNASLNAVRFDGTIAVIGILGGVEAKVALTSILMKQARIRGVFVGSRAMFEEMSRALDASELRPIIDRVLPFTEAPQAFAHMESQRHFGKIVIRF